MVFLYSPLGFYKIRFKSVHISKEIKIDLHIDENLSFTNHRSCPSVHPAFLSSSSSSLAL